MALHQLRRDPLREVVALLTAVTEGYDRISMHGVRRILLERQATALGLPLEIVTIPPQCVNAEYESRMEAIDGAVEIVGNSEARLNRMAARASRKRASSPLRFWLPPGTCPSSVLSWGSAKISHHVPRRA